MTIKQALISVSDKRGVLEFAQGLAAQGVNLLSTGGTAKMLASPLGSGVGSTGSASLYGDAPVIIENQYLFTAHEVGWLGLGLFVVIFTIIMIRLWKLRQSWKALAVFASGAGLTVIGLLLPVWVDDTVSIIWWGLAAVVLAEGGVRGKTTNQKAKRTT